MTSCQNITDVGHLADDSEIDPEGEDKVLAQARAEGKTALEVARRYEEGFRADCAALNIHPADSYPRASECIGLMIDLIARLIETGHAYPVPGGSVYFDARSFPSYGELSGNRLADLRPGHRSGGPAASRARNRASGSTRTGPCGRPRRRRELTYGSPWGTGFPGWHTECSAMSLHYLGETIDVHTGGIDLRFPHHEDERAQSNSVTGHEVVQHWVHGEHLLFEGRKMAKSTGNVVLLADLTARGLDLLALRLAFLDHRYRQQLNLTWAVLDAADRTVRRWRERVAEWARCQRRLRGVRRRVTAAFDDDLDTPAALRACAAWRRTPRSARVQVRNVCVRRPDARPGPGAGHRTRIRAEAPPGTGGGPAAARAAARAAADWATADRLRDELGTLGVTVTDTPDGQAWTVRGR